MSRPVKLSEALVHDARLATGLSKRSIAGQIEFWASLGKALEPLMCGEQALALQKSGEATPISALLSTVGLPAGRKRVAEFFKSQPLPHYEPDPEHKGNLIRTDVDGTRTRGRFVNRKFVVIDSGKKQTKR